MLGQLCMPSSLRLTQPIRVHDRRHGQGSLRSLDATKLVLCVLCADISFWVAAVTLNMMTHQMHLPVTRSSVSADGAAGISGQISKGCV